MNAPDLPRDWYEKLGQCDLELARNYIQQAFDDENKQAAGQGGRYIYRNDLASVWLAFKQNPTITTAAQFIEFSPSVWMFFAECCPGGIFFLSNRVLRNAQSIHRDIPPERTADNHPELSQRLRERADSAIISLRILFDTLRRTLANDYPEFAASSRWDDLPRLGSFAGCFLLCVYMTKEVDSDLRNELELRMRRALAERWPGSEQLQMSIYTYVTDRMAPLSRVERGEMMFFFASKWMVNAITDGAPVARADELAASISQFLINEIPGFWAAVVDHTSN